MSKHVATGFIAAALIASASLAVAAVPSPTNSTAVWSRSTTVASHIANYNGSCDFPTVCPSGDSVYTIAVVVKDQFNLVMVGVGQSEIDAEGTCLLGGGSPCSQVVSVLSNGATNGSGFTTITVAKAGGCCADLRVVARGVILSTLTYRSYDYTADLKCDVSDLGFLADTFNKLTTDVGYNACFNFNCDTKVDVSDLGFFASHFNHLCV